MIEEFDELEVPPLRLLSESEREEQARLRDELFEKGSTFKPTRREEIVGIDNILGEIDDIIHWLVHSEVYGRHNSRLQPGAVFGGPPGVGKTLVSRYIATASGALFINVRDFVHQGALYTDRDISDLFARARRSYEIRVRPVVLFWDEFENSAMDRNSDRSTPEQRAVVSQLTAELDGIHGKNEGILLIGCTNFLTSIDEALMRRGRMGVQIEFHAPDRAGKEKILDYYLGQMTVVPGIDLGTLSYFFPKDNTAADIEEACVEAWLHAVHRCIDTNVTTDPILSEEDLVAVFIKQLVGPPTTFTLPKDERFTIAIHECGHALAALIFGVPLRLITVQPGKEALGRIIIDDLREYVGTIPEYLNRMRVAVGGMAAEIATGVEPITGSTFDVSKVTADADRLNSGLNMQKRIGLFNPAALDRRCGYSILEPQVSSSTLEDADADVRELINMVRIDTESAMQGIGRERIRNIAEVVNERVTMTGKQFHQLVTDICGYDPAYDSEEVS